MTSHLYKTRFATALLAAAAFMAVAMPSAHAGLIYDNLGSTQAGADPVQSYGPLANSFNTGSNAGLLAGITALLKSGSDQLIGNVQVKLLADNGMTPGNELVSLGSLLSSSVSTAAFASYSFMPVTAFNLAANTTYWVQIKAAQPVDIEWSWSTDLTALGVSGQASYSKELGVLPNASAGPYQMSVSIAAVPEPTSAALVLVGAALIGGAARRSRR